MPSRRWSATTIGAGKALARMPERGVRDSETALRHWASGEVAGVVEAEAV